MTANPPTVPAGTVGTSPRPRLLDLFCGAGGASAGYAAAGFEVVGVDLVASPHYPFEFIQADARDVLGDREFLTSFDSIAASPTCQTFARVTDWRGSRGEHPDLLRPTLWALGGLPTPFVVENVPEAVDAGALYPDYLLCGTQFGLRVGRHRAFQVGNWVPPAELLPPCHCRASRRELIPFAHKNERAFADAMGCTWMTNMEARQAIPPAYTEHIGSALMAHLKEAAA